MYTGSLSGGLTADDAKMAQQLGIVSRDFEKAPPLRPPKVYIDATVDDVASLDTCGAAAVGGERQLHSDLYRLLLSGVAADALVVLFADAAGCPGAGHQFVELRNPYGNGQPYCCDRCEATFPASTPAFHCTCCGAADLCLACYKEDPQLHRPGASLSQLVHLPILAARSGYVSALLGGGFADSLAASGRSGGTADGRFRIRLSDEQMEKRALHLLLTAVYTDDMNLCGSGSDSGSDTSSTIAEQVQQALYVWQAAKYLDIPSAIHIAESFVVGNMDASIVVDVLGWAKEVECGFVQRQCMRFMRQNYAAFAASSAGFGRLGQEDMVQLLESNFLNASEAEVVQSIVRWARASTGKCDNCSEGIALVGCRQCTADLCEACDAAIHAFRVLAAHDRGAVVARDSPTAEPDMERLAALVPLVRLAYVPPQDASLALLVAAGIISPAALAEAGYFQAPDQHVQVCVRCNRPAYRGIQCSSCAVTLCDNCKNLLRAPSATKALASYHDGACQDPLQQTAHLMSQTRSEVYAPLVSSGGC